MFFFIGGWCPGFGRSSSGLGELGSWGGVRCGAGSTEVSKITMPSSRVGNL